MPRQPEMFVRAVEFQTVRKIPRHTEVFPISLGCRYWLGVLRPAKFPDRLKYSSSYRLRNSRPSGKFSDRLKYSPRSQIFLRTSPPPTLSRPTTPPPSPRFMSCNNRPHLRTCRSSHGPKLIPGGDDAIWAPLGLRHSHENRNVNSHIL